MQFQKKGMTRVAAFAGAAALVASAFTVSAGAATKVTYSATKACLVTDTGGINDKSFNASAYAGLTAATALSKNITGIYLASTQESDYATNIATFEAQKCNIIVTVGFLMSEATWVAAVASPKQHFAQVDNNNAAPYGDTTGVAGPLSNYLGLTYNTQEDAFLGGYEAAAYAASVNPKAPKVATYGGMQFSSVTTYEDGFFDGVAYYNNQAMPKVDVKVLGWDEKTQKGTFIGSFNDQATAATVTTAFLSQGATTVFPVAGSDGLGTNSAVKTWNASHSVKANVEWVDTDGCVSDSTDCSIFLNSITKGVTTSVTAAIVAQATGMWGNGGNYVGTLKNGGAAFVQDNGLTTFFSAKAGAALAAKIKSISAGIQSGKIAVAIAGK